MVFRKLNDILEQIRKNEPQTFIVVCANDNHTLSAVTKAVEDNLLKAVLIGDESLIRLFFKEHHLNKSRYRIINQPNDQLALLLATDMINRGEGDVIMKGLISTDQFIKAILNKENGLVTLGNLLSHVAVIENKNYHKLLITGDVAVIPLPTLQQKEIIIRYLVKTAKILGITNPKVAVIAPTEKVVPSIVSTLDAELLRKMNLSGEIEGCIVEGPFALDVAIDTGAALVKGLNNTVAGDADCLLFPNIDAGNVFYKANTKLASSEAAAVLFGAKVPVVLPSRGDSIQSKLYSMALAAFIGITEKEVNRAGKLKDNVTT